MVFLVFRVMQPIPDNCSGGWADGRVISKNGNLVIFRSVVGVRLGQGWGKHVWGKGGACLGHGRVKDL